MGRRPRTATPAAHESRRPLVRRGRDQRQLAAGHLADLEGFETRHLPRDDHRDTHGAEGDRGGVGDQAEARDLAAAARKVYGTLRLDVTGARGVDPKKAEREFGARLQRRLREQGSLVPVAKADLRARVVGVAAVGRKLMSFTKEVRTLRYLNGKSFTARLSRPEEYELDGDPFGKAIALRATVGHLGLVVQVPADE